jgi:uncharacterized C2H2 Zn-finger protein
VIELHDLIEDRDIHEVYLLRYRADYVMRKLWEITQGRSHWRSAGSHRPGPGAGSGGGVGVAGIGQATRAKYALVTVPECAVLHFEGERLRLWSTHVNRTLNALPFDQRKAVEDFLMAPRCSAVFSLVKRWAMVRRNESASEHLAKAALGIVILADEIRETATGGKG